MSMHNLILCICSFWRSKVLAIRIYEKNMLCELLASKAITKNRRNAAFHLDSLFFLHKILINTKEILGGG